MIFVSCAYRPPLWDGIPRKQEYIVLEKYFLRSLKLATNKIKFELGENYIGMSLHA